MNKKLRDRYLIVSAIQMLFLPAITILQQTAAKNPSLMAHMARINETWPQNYPVQRLATTAVIFFVMMTWAILHFQRKNRRYQDPKDRIYPILPAEMALTLLAYTSFVSYLSPEIASTYYYAVILLTIAMAIEIAKVANYLVTCPNETIQPKLKSQKKPASKNAGKGNDFVKRSKKK